MSFGGEYGDVSEDQLDRIAQQGKEHATAAAARLAEHLSHGDPAARAIIATALLELQGAMPELRTYDPYVGHSELSPVAEDTRQYLDGLEAQRNPGAIDTGGLE
jgi:hypothetical protein